jgi:phosphoadenosine phosphosulfate reductase
VLKLGPAAKSIAEELGGNAVVFMGQRKLESFQRSVEPRVASNPWVPGQVSASPIHNWNALEVWLYIFKEKAEFNPLYNRGFLRMGCYLCPATPLAELESLAETHPILYERWQHKLQDWAKRYGFPEEWAKLGFWRWKKLPSGQMNVINEMGLRIEAYRKAPSQTLELNIVKGVSPCTSSGFSLEGQFSAGVDLDRVSRILPIFGNTHYSEDLGALRTKLGETSITLFSSGSLVVRGGNEETVGRVARQLERAVRRAVFCQACGSCVPQCEQAALNLQEGKISVDEEKCIQCMKCDSWPCPTYLG